MYIDFGGVSLLGPAPPHPSQFIVPQVRKYFIQNQKVLFNFSDYFMKHIKTIVIKQSQRHKRSGKITHILVF